MDQDLVLFSVLMNEILKLIFVYVMIFKYFFQAALGAHGVHSHGAAHATPRRQDRGGHRAASGRTLPSTLPHSAQVWDSVTHF